MFEQEVLCGIGGWDTAISGWGVDEVRRPWSIGSTGGVGKREGRLQLVISCSARDKD